VLPEFKRENMTRGTYIIIALLMAIFTSCKKENQQVSNSSLIGLWEVKLLTISTLDSLNNIIKIDTAIYTDEYGNPITFLEQYTQDYRLFMFANNTADTNKIFTYTLTGNNLKINISDNILPFNNRTISKIDDNNLEVFQIIITSSLKQKWVQSYLRK